jgi:hypothetical protein
LVLCGVTIGDGTERSLFSIAFGSPGVGGTESLKPVDDEILFQREKNIFFSQKNLNDFFS